MKYSLWVLRTIAFSRSMELAYILLGLPALGLAVVQFSLIPLLVGATLAALLVVAWATWFGLSPEARMAYREGVDPVKRTLSSGPL